LPAEYLADQSCIGIAHRLEVLRARGFGGAAVSRDWRKNCAVIELLTKSELVIRIEFGKIGIREPVQKIHVEVLDQSIRGDSKRSARGGVGYK